MSEQCNEINAMTVKGVWGKLIVPMAFLLSPKRGGEADDSKKVWH